MTEDSEEFVPHVGAILTIMVPVSKLGGSRALLEGEFSRIKGRMARQLPPGLKLSEGLRGAEQRGVLLGAPLRSDRGEGLMEDAERAGLVSIERVGDYTHYYRLTIPDGRNWVNVHERELQVGAGEGMVKRDPRSPY